MAKHPNQFTITVQSSGGIPNENVDKPYGIITEKELIAACQVLGKDSTAIALFVVLASNKNGYVFDFSPQAYQNKYGISVKRWTHARQVLEKNGYLVPAEKHHLTFYSLPPHLRNVTFLPAEQASENSDVLDNQSPVDGGITAESSHLAEEAKPHSPVDGSIIPHGRGDNPPQTVVLSPVDGGSNNTTIQNNINNIEPEYPEDNTITETEDCILVLENDIPVLESERDMLLDSIRESFGEWEDTWLDIMSAYSKSTMHGRKGRAALAAYIDELKKVFKRLTEQRSFNMNKKKREYKAAINATMPGDIVEYMKVKLILDKFEQGYKAAHNGRGWPWTWGVWVNGWNEELQEPNFTVSMFALPPSVIAKQRHNLEGIPKEYYKTLGKKE